MQEDFHYYATYAAAYLSGYSHEESLIVAYSAQFVDCCTATLLTKIKGPVSAATTQLTMELADARTDIIGLQNITRIWASFHFLPHNLYAELPKHSRRYMQKYRLICNANGDLVTDTVAHAKDKGLQACGVAMHVLADTWAHRYFAGTPSLVINNATEFYDLRRERPIRFGHNPINPDNVDKGHYTKTVYQSEEASIMNLGHGRAGHLPDYSFMRYQFMPSWGNYEVIVKDNPSDYYQAFCQMVYAMKYLRGNYTEFQKDTYDEDAVSPWKDEIMAILTKQQIIASKDWKSFGEKLSGQTIEDFDIVKYEQEYIKADRNKKDDTFLGRFILAALSQKSMVTNKIYKSKNLLAGYSVDFSKYGFKGIRDFKQLIGK